METGDEAEGASQRAQSSSTQPNPTQYPSGRASTRTDNQQNTARTHKKAKRTGWLPSSFITQVNKQLACLLK
jgi:hypothetical protein